MNTNPPFQRGRGFGYGPVVDHVHQGNTSLEWATFALVLLLLFLFGMYLVAWAGRGRGRFGPPQRIRLRGGRPDAREMLRMRFASGQMSREEFLQATSDLESTAAAVEQPPPPA
ncbi:MAG: hypothetical protein ACRDL2_09760 [Gaiellaceae bacterium]